MLPRTRSTKSRRLEREGLVLQHADTLSKMLNKGSTTTQEEWREFIETKIKSVMKYSPNTNTLDLGCTLIRDYIRLFDLRWDQIKSPESNT